MEHLLVNKHCDCKYPITWVAENLKTCRINRNYVERHEPTYNGVSISVKLPCDDGGDWAEFAANEEGWMYVADWNAEHLPEVSLAEGVAEVEANVDKILAAMEKEAIEMVEHLEREGY